MFEELYRKYDGRYADLVDTIFDYLKERGLTRDFRKWGEKR
jgi:hypothetical protein